MLEQLDLTVTVDRDKYEKEMNAVQLRLVRQQQRLRASKHAVVVMYEGWDASGKGGSILRITQKLDPRGFHVWPIGAPDEAERRYHYLWRFWTRMPAYGGLTIFDRSWYGRVLVERVERLCAKEDWQRAYQEIRDFERCLVDNGVVLVKFWMHITKDEQLRRFKERESDPFKQYKIGPDDWRNREKWDDYLVAAEQMLKETDVPHAPWHLIAAEHKHYARLRTAMIVAEAIERVLGTGNAKS